MSFFINTSKISSPAEVDNKSITLNGPKAGIPKDLKKDPQLSF